MLIFNYFIHFYANLLILKLRKQFPLTSQNVLEAASPLRPSATLSSDSYSETIELAEMHTRADSVVAFSPISTFSMKKVDEETGKYYGRKAVSFVLKRQPWVWASTH
eukprot:XP_014632974.1 uncharacterized protein LOC102665674 [Glycine max]